jgi:hypothetical protein
VSYITAAELARRCEVTRAAVTLAIKQHRISPGKVRREGKSVLIDAAHGMSVLGHHRHRRPAAPPAPPAPAPVITDDDLGGLLAWGAPVRTELMEAAAVELAAPVHQAGNPAELWADNASWANALLDAAQWGPPPWSADQWATLDAVLDLADDLAAEHGAYTPELMAMLQAEGVV